MFEPGEVEDLVQLAADRGARVIADEVHAPLIRSDLRHTVAATIDPDVVVTVTSASKAWNIPGLKCAQVVLTRDEDAEKWAAYFTSDKIGVATLGLVGNAAAYADARGWLDETVERIDANRRLLADLVAENLPGVRLTQLEGTYLACRLLPLGLDQPADYFKRGQGRHQRRCAVRSRREGHVAQLRHVPTSSSRSPRGWAWRRRSSGMILTVGHGAQTADELGETLRTAELRPSTSAVTGKPSPPPVRAGR